VFLREVLFEIMSLPLQHIGGSAQDETGNPLRCRRASRVAPSIRPECGAGVHSGAQVLCNERVRALPGIDAPLARGQNLLHHLVVDESWHGVDLARHEALHDG
jgi:hypothetical protein